MGLFSFISKQFIEVIQWTDTSTDTLVYRFPVADNEIKMGAQLTVRESQLAVFVNEGKIADVFSPGRYELSTQNMPILTTLKSWKYGFNSPFKAEVYFINTKQFIDKKWGTTNPIMMRDKEFGMIRLRAFGIYSFKAIDAVKLMKEIFGTNQQYDTEAIEGQLKRFIVSGLSDLLGEANISALDLASNYDELSENAKNKFQRLFGDYGLEITSFYIENISLPEEVEKTLDKRTSMGIIGNMGQYAQYQAAEAIRDAAQNPGGVAGAGVGIGVGSVLGSMMGQNLYKEQQGHNIEAKPLLCGNCNSQIAAGQNFCGNCGKTAGASLVSCISCKKEIEANQKFCPECGSPQTVERNCSNCKAKVEPEVKFCSECGSKM